MWTLDTILNLLNQYRRRATYGAVGEVLGVPARSVIRGRPRNPRHSWVVNKKTGLPTGYAPAQRHRNLLQNGHVLDNGPALRAWLNNPIP